MFRRKPIYFHNQLGKVYCKCAHLKNAIELLFESSVTVVNDDDSLSYLHNSLRSVKLIKLITEKINTYVAILRLIIGFGKSLM